MEQIKLSNRQFLEKVGQALKVKRIQRNLSQYDLAVASGVSHASIARFECGKGNPSLQNLLLLMRPLGMLNFFTSMFQEPEASPALLAQSTTQKTKMRVRKPMMLKNKTHKTWTWGEGS